MASIERQLLSNQLWETVGFVAKGAFLLGLTPAMIRQWGSQGYGEFALASSVFVLLSLDGPRDSRAHPARPLPRCRKTEGGSCGSLQPGLLTFAGIGALTLGSLLLA